MIEKIYTSFWVCIHFTHDLNLYKKGAEKAHPSRISSPSLPMRVMESSGREPCVRFVKSQLHPTTHTYTHIHIPFYLLLIFLQHTMTGIYRGGGGKGMLETNRLSGVFEDLALETVMCCKPSRADVSRSTSDLGSW